MTVKPPPLHCGSCWAEIYFAFPEPGATGRDGRPAGKMPIDAGSAGTGSAEVWLDGAVLRYRILGKGEDPAPGRFRGMPHWATCEQAGQWRNR